MKGFIGAGGAQEHKQDFTADSDHLAVLCGQDRGVTPVEHLLHALATGSPPPRATGRRGPL